MVYCTVNDVRDILPEYVLEALTDDSTSGGERTIDESKINDAIEWASRIVDAKIGRRYKTPLATVPEVIKEITVDLTIYRLYARLELDPLPEEKYKHAMELLQAIADGAVLLDVPQRERIKVKYTDEEEW